MRTYRALLHLYPRRFRLDHADDMVALVEDQLRDEGTLRVVLRTAVDLLVTVPTRHLEARMHRSTATPLLVVLAALATALVVIGGPIGLVGGVAVLALAAVVWQRNRPVVAAADDRWWKFLLAGVGLLLALVAITTVTGELPEGGWYVAMVAMLTSFGLLAAGVVLGAVRLRSVRDS